MNERKVKPIENGTVLDHLPAKSALQILKVLDLDFDSPVEIIINVNSKAGKKDIIFIEDKDLTQKEVEKIGLLAEGSTWNTIKNQKVVKKEKINLPLEAENIINCPNQKCITNYEEIPTKFAVLKDSVSCEYCNKAISTKELSKHFK
ncbi:MAG: aspartate carbamoyltransferase regulatory subunit [archaeon]|jgi:aspartate carbamoyltransferase regulatory subunit